MIRFEISSFKLLKKPMLRYITLKNQLKNNMEYKELIKKAIGLTISRKKSKRYQKL
jgi:hypothetical protein